MNLLPLYDIQRNVDKVIEGNLETNIDTEENIDFRRIAFKVELGEFANETGFFKYWKHSHKMNRKKALEEFADCMAFMLSLGISQKYELVKELHPVIWKKVPKKELFNYLFKNSLDSKEKWKAAFEHLIVIGLKSGFTIAEMEVAYYTKSGINIERQVGGY